MIASSLERRVWAEQGRLRTFPNLYIMLMGSPGVGKQVIEEVRGLLAETLRPDSQMKAFHIASDSTTRASLMDELKKARQVFLAPQGTEEFSSLILMSEEFRVLMPSYDQEFISRLDRIYNCPTQHSESRRTGQVRELNIVKPIINILSGAQPAYLADTFPENAWATGVSRRLMMIYASEGPLTSIFE